MSTIGASGKAQARRYSPEEKAQAVRMVFALRKETGTSQGTVRRVADQLGYGVESVRGWVLCRHRHKTHYADLRVMPRVCRGSSLTGV
jgi:transposase-like protein